MVIGMLLTWKLSEMSMMLNKGGTGVDWLFTAMAHWQLDRKDEARKLYDRADEWMNANPGSVSEELRRFHAEAAEVPGR